ncbi:MAG: ribonuclease E/G, partial [Alphaproteobacteria bacterium]
RVVVVSGNRVEEFDFETQTKKQLKGNIYLAKVTRVEPSLQAAFVEYGGNRHGFLAFSEIHPDYYQIPHEDRLALLAEQAEEDEYEEEDIEEASASSAPSESNGQGHAHDHPSADELSIEAQRAAEAAMREGETPPPAEGPPASFDEHVAPTESFDQPKEEARPAVTESSGLEPIEISTSADVALSDEAEALREGLDDLPSSERASEVETIETGTAAEAPPEEIGAQDAMEELPRRRRKMRRYKIQEVIKRRQILLVQVVKEERGNKGAALTTFLSLAGRYCVLMPNTDRGGGISRKITSGADRKRLKEIAVELEVPEGMGLIVRTAGANKTKAELKRDFEYLLRLWESVRELTLQSTAPALVYEEGNLVKRSIRDLYGRDIEEVLVEGEEAHKEARAFMKMLTPSHAKNVQLYTDKLPLFQRYQVETQLDSLFSPTVELRSGGYIVINSTEALVAIDVNSGKATREHSIEETALKTNLEAAEEVARQLRLRDLAGLIVIDFIDMEEYRHDRAVERKLKDCLKTDRARIQVGHISAFGLLEMSRQRLRASVLEGSTLVCETCEGAGRVPSTETTALRILRALEEEGVRGRLDGAHIKAPPEVALYLLNYKRPMLQQIEARFGLPCYIESSPEMKAGHYVIERAPEGLIDWQPAKPVISPESGFAVPASEAEEEVPAEPEDEGVIESEGEVIEAGDGEPREIRVSEDGRGDREGGRRGRRRRG